MTLRVIQLGDLSTRGTMRGTPYVPRDHLWTGSMRAFSCCRTQ